MAKFLGFFNIEFYYHHQVLKLIKVSRDLKKVYIIHKRILSFYIYLSQEMLFEII